MELLVIIVNYNVKYFLKQCLTSVRIASKNMDCEVYVVDNNSVDGSVEMVKQDFPEVKLIANKNNVGFSKANNQAIRLAKGKYVLLLNPDTLVEEDTFTKVVNYMNAHPEAGGLGVHMIDGKGNFLPESKRGLPTPWVAFYKIFGLSKLFPKSKRFGRYHLTYLDKNQIHEVEILSGAFMLLRKTVLDKTGLLDEDYFMYGEDIDLSYRIIKAGYKNIYFPDTRIIHYKGESTKKSSVNYVFVFYKAMVIFARKHFSSKRAQLFSILIKLAIFLRAFLSITKRFIQKIIVPVCDFAFIYAGFYLIKLYWEHEVWGSNGDYYPLAYLYYVVPSYILIWLLAIFFSSGYDKPLRLIKIFQGVVFGTIMILVIYALLPENMRFSRALILIGASWSLVYLLTSRIVLHIAGLKSFSLEGEQNKRFLIAGNIDEATRITQFIKQIQPNTGFIGLISPQAEKNSNTEYIGTIEQIDDIIEIYKINEVIFCASDLPSNEIINNMSTLQHKDVEFKIAPPESMFIIGSNSIHAHSDLYIININAINKPANRRSKQMLDLICALFLLLIFPITLFFVKRPLHFIKNIFLVLFFQKSWVGYCKAGNVKKLPKIKNGILNSTHALPHKKLDNDTLEKLNILYARDYQVSNDINIIWKGFKFLGS